MGSATRPIRSRRDSSPLSRRGREATKNTKDAKKKERWLCVRSAGAAGEGSQLRVARLLFEAAGDGRPGCFPVAALQLRVGERGDQMQVVRARRAGALVPDNGGLRVVQAQRQRRDARRTRNEVGVARRQPAVANERSARGIEVSLSLCRRGVQQERRRVDRIARRRL